MMSTIRTLALLSLVGAAACAKSHPSEEGLSTRQDEEDDEAAEGTGRDDEGLEDEDRNVADGAPGIGEGGPGDDPGIGAGRRDGGPGALDEYCQTTADCTEDIARSLCMQDCRVCVQSVDAGGNPVIWLVQHYVSSCEETCPEPYLDHRAYWDDDEAGVDAGHLGGHARLTD
jgi:hypothetical protein